MQVLTVSEAGTVTSYGKMSQMQVIDFASLHLGVSDRSSTYIASTIDVVWLIVTLGPSEERRTIAFVLEGANDFELATVLTRICKLAACVAKRLVLPEAEIAAYLN